MSKSDISAEEIEAERRAAEVGGLMGRIKENGAVINFRGCVALFYSNISCRGYFKNVKIERDVRDPKNSTLTIKGENFSHSYHVENETWKMVDRDDNRSGFGYEGFPYLRVELGPDGLFTSTAHLRFYPSKPESLQDKSAQ